MTTNERRAPAVAVARQPIYRTDGALLGHEYLYRAAGGRLAGVDRWPSARQDVASGAVLGTLYGARPPAGDGLVFVNITRAFLVGRLPLPPADRRLVLEVVESVPADRDTLTGLARLKAAGYRIALDDWTASSDQSAMLPHAEFVKVDCRDLDDLGTAGLRQARTRGARLVAERVADEDLRARCVALRFDLLQGYALGRPTLVTDAA